jgi:hypothetical protein
MWQATREACSPVQLQQLLQPDLYPDNDASVLATAACARVFIFVKMLSRAKAEKELKEQQRRETLQRNMVIGGALGIALVCIVVLCRRR